MVVVVVVGGKVGGVEVVVVVGLGGSGSGGLSSDERKAKMTTMMKINSISTNPSIILRLLSSSMRHLCNKTSIIVIFEGWKGDGFFEYIYKYLYQSLDESQVNK